MIGEPQVIRQYSFLIDHVKEDKNTRHDPKRLVWVIMIDVEPVIIEKTKYWGQKSEDKSVKGRAVDHRRRCGQVLDLWCVGLVYLVDGLF